MIIKTPSRLHLTLIDLNGRYGRIDGGVGITTRSPRLVLEALGGSEETLVEFSTTDVTPDVKKDYQDKILSAARKICQYLSLEENYRFKVKEVFPSHSGLGSGTQLSLATAKLILKMNNQDLPAHKIGKIVGRGGTSGIGVASFEDGGFIVDSGHKKDIKKKFLPSSASKASPPPLIARYDFPEDWKLLLVIPHVKRKVFGEGEVDIFQKYCPLPLGEVQELTHLLFMKMLPAVIEEDIDYFGEAVNAIQSIGFKKVELKLQNPFISELMEDLRDAGAAGVGMSSFGPTVFAVTDTNINEIYRAARESMKDKDGEIIITGGQNSGYHII